MVHIPTFGVPRSATNPRAFFLNVSGGSAAGFATEGYPCTLISDPPAQFAIEAPNNWAALNAFSIEIRDGEKLLERRTINGSSTTPWSIDTEIAYAIEHGEWILKPTTSQSYVGLRGVGNTLQRWYWVEEFHNDERAGWGWHGQSKQSSGFAFGPRELAGGSITDWTYSLMFCRTYGRKQLLTDKIKVEDVRPLLIDRIPDGLAFDKALSLRYWRRSNIASANWVKLPADIEAAGLDCRDAAIATVPDAAAISGTIRFDGSPVAEIPSGWTTLADWHFADSALHQWSIPHVKSLDASRSRLDRLPDNFTADGDVSIDRCPLRRLPSGMTVGGRLSARYCWFETIPSDLTADVLDLRYSVVDAWPESLPNVHEVIR